MEEFGLRTLCALVYGRAFLAAFLAFLTLLLRCQKAAFLAGDTVV